MLDEYLRLAYIPVGTHIHRFICGVAMSGVGYYG
jgi:hypothetical protein